jgi:hypothetical protein
MTEAERRESDRALLVAELQLVKSRLGVTWSQMVHAIGDAAQEEITSHLAVVVGMLQPEGEA